MATELDSKLEIDRQRIKNSVRLQTPVEITSYTLPRNMEIYIRNILTTFLEECHQEHLEEYLQFCLGELLTNAKKANTKRVYFKEKGLDINDPDDYKKGMEHFKEDTLTNIDHYLELQKKAGLYIKLDLQIRGDKVKIEIRNKAKLTVFESERIQNKINGVQKYNDMENVFENVIDQSEGAGLGIIIIILMLQKVGLAKENYQVESVGEETITRIILPCNKEIFSAEETMVYEFVNLQNTIPIISSHYETLKQMLSSPTMNKNEVYKYIRDDVTLSLALIIAGVKKDKTCNTILKAFNLFTEDELRKVFSNEENNFSIVQETDLTNYLWEHSRRTAFFAYNLFKNKPEVINKYDSDLIYTSGLLNGLGFILLNCASTEQHSYIDELCKNYEAPEKVSDIFWNGNAQAYLNLIFTKRAGLPDDLSGIVATWNYWEMAPENCLEAIYTVYLAEMLQYYLEKGIEFYQVDKRVLDYFNITSENQFHILAIKMSQSLEG